MAPLEVLLESWFTSSVETGNHSHPEMIWGAWNIPQAALLKLMIVYTRDGGLREALEVPKGSQANCSV